MKKYVKVSSKIVYETSDSRVINTYPDEYEVQAISIINEDGLISKSWRTVGTFAKHYERDNLGKTTSIYFEYDPKEAAIHLANVYHNR